MAIENLRDENLLRFYDGIRKQVEADKRSWGRRENERSGSRSRPFAMAVVWRDAGGHDSHCLGGRLPAVGPLARARLVAKHSGRRTVGG
jgi:hypothetical protein